MNRRLPVYLLLDCSGSMTGQPIESVRQGVKALLGDLRTDPVALETAFLSVITFNSTAHQVTPLTDLGAFHEPALSATGSTALGEALMVLANCVQTEVRKPSDTQKGDWKPLVFLFTDGKPTDEWEGPARSLRERRCTVVACAAGPEADAQMLKTVTETVVQIESLKPEDLKAFFKWVSSSIRTSSQALDTVPAGNGTSPLPPPPPEVRIVP